MDDSLLVSRIGPLVRANVKTMPYPGFPTDMQPQIAAALCLAQGTSIITDSVWNTRFRYTDEFKRMLMFHPSPPPPQAATAAI